ncbi:hypothetical protein [Hydrogenobacter thermophilus]|uniref:LolA family protein n=1 Tax=Hydrogenobacter thermophilus TaxID=940 RepID=UPI0030F6D9A2
MFLLLFLFMNYVSFANPLDEAIHRFEKEYNYYSYIMKVSDGTVLKYFYAKPGYVRMDIIEPFKGATLVYDPNTNKVFVRPFKNIKSLILKLSPDNPMIKSSKGHRIDESDILTLLNTVKELRDKGEMIVEDRGSCYYMDVKGGRGFMVRGNIARFVLILEKGSFFPKYVASYDKDGGLIEEVSFEDISINVGFSKGIFMIR